MRFGEILQALARKRNFRLPPFQDPEPLAGLPYAEELSLKQEALRDFWKDHRLPGALGDVVAAPEPRGYRATSKRRASAPVSPRKGRASVRSVGGLTLGAPSLLDPPEHTAVYDFLLDALTRAGARAVAATLNYAIVRGRGDALAVILNVSRFDAPVVRGAKPLAAALQGAGLGVRSALLYLDPTESDYYLEARRPAKTLGEKHLFGPRWLEVSVGDARLRFPPTVFSQVNEAMLPALTGAAASGLGPLAGQALLDLYCGYGLFSVVLGRQAKAVTGIDHDGPAIEAARGNAEFFKVPARFIAGRIDGDLVRRVPTARGPEVALLDPPRQGTEAGVVEAVAARRPERVVHICCGADEIPREVAAWTASGYALERAQPLDLFAGTVGIETVLQLTPKRRNNRTEEV
jgi:tRNA/tmRNA/rRNA uracil-C5-methylase (TrmA/RlmC/RlmD family)